MSRVKRGVTAHARHKKSSTKLKAIKGDVKTFTESPSRPSRRPANMPIEIGGNVSDSFVLYGFIRINAAARLFDLSYSRFINGLNRAEIEI